MVTTLVHIYRLLSSSYLRLVSISEEALPRELPFAYNLSIPTPRQHSFTLTTLPLVSSSISIFLPVIQGSFGTVRPNQLYIQAEAVTRSTFTKATVVYFCTNLAIRPSKTSLAFSKASTIYPQTRWILHIPPRLDCPS